MALYNISLYVPRYFIFLDPLVPSVHFCPLYVLAFILLCSACEVDGQILPSANAQVLESPAQGHLTFLVAMTGPRLKEGCQGHRHH